VSRLETRFQKAEDSPGFLLWKAANQLQRLHKQCLRDLGVTSTQFSLMACLMYLCQLGPVTAALIVEHSGMDKMSVSDLICSLERKKLLRRRRHPADGRSWLLESTPAGERVTNAAIGRIEALDGTYFARARDPQALHADLLALSSAG
jgi:DNA-binding MarR family transcriptional regulator